MSRLTSAATELGRGATLLACVLLVAAPPARAAAPEPWCGTATGEWAEIWDQVWMETEALEEIGRAKAWSAAPGRASTLLSQFALLQRGSARQGEQTVGLVTALLPSVTDWRRRLDTAARAGDGVTYTAVLGEARQRMEKLRRTFPAAPPITTGISATALPALSNSLTLQVEAGRLVTNFPVSIRVRLADQAGRPQTEADFAEAHTRKVHAFLLDPALEDYHHEHPEPTGRPGEFAFSFTPRRPGHYTLWVDVLPLATLRQEFPQAVLRSFFPSTNSPSTQPRLEWAGDGLRQRLRFDRPVLKARQPVQARLRVTDDDGRPCFGLEPWMGAFAHVVGVMDDGRTLLHVHSPGEPPAAAQRSGPEVAFRFIPPQRGTLKLFVQTRLDGRVHLARFTVPVE